MTNDYDNTFNAQNYGISKDNQFDFDQTQEQVNTLPTTKKPTQKKKATTRSKETTEDIYITGRIIRKKLQLTILVYDDCNPTEATDKVMDFWIDHHKGDIKQVTKAIFDKFK